MKKVLKSKNKVDDIKDISDYNKKGEIKVLIILNLNLNDLSFKLINE